MVYRFREFRLCEDKVAGYSPATSNPARITTSDKGYLRSLIAPLGGNAMDGGSAALLLDLRGVAILAGTSLSEEACRLGHEYDDEDEESYQASQASVEPVLTG